MNPDPPFTAHGDEPIEARIVSWVLGEASEFEAAELKRLCEERPELLVFRQRIREIHGLLGEDEKSDPADLLKLPPEKRRAIEELFGEEVVRLPVPKHAGRTRRRIGRALLAVAACVALSMLVVRYVPFQEEGRVVLEVKPRIPGMNPFGPGKTDSESGRQMTRRFFKTESERIRSKEVLGDVVERLGLDERWDVDEQAAIDRVRDKVKVGQFKDTDWIEIRAKDKNERDAKQIAHEVALAYRDYRGELEREESEAALRELQKQVRNLEDKVEDRRKVLTTIARTKRITRKGNDSRYGQSGVDQDEGARDRLRRFYQIEQEKMQLESQVKSLLKYDDDQLMTYASGLDLPDNAVREVYPEYLDAKRKVESLKIEGVGDKHPTVLAAEEQVAGMKRQLDEGVVNLRATLQAQLDLANERMKSAQVAKNEDVEDAIKRGLDAQDFVDAKRDFETEQQLLQKLKLKLIGETVSSNMPRESVVIHEDSLGGDSLALSKRAIAAARPAAEVPESAPTRFDEALARASNLDSAASPSAPSSSLSTVVEGNAEVLPQQLADLEATQDRRGEGVVAGYGMAGSGRARGDVEVHRRRMGGALAARGLATDAPVDPHEAELPEIAGVVRQSESLGEADEFGSGWGDRADGLGTGVVANGVRAGDSFVPDGTVEFDDRIAELSPDRAGDDTSGASNTTDFAAGRVDVDAFGMDLDLEGGLAGADPAPAPGVRPAEGDRGLSDSEDLVRPELLADADKDWAMEAPELNAPVPSSGPVPARENRKKPAEAEALGMVGGTNLWGSVPKDENVLDGVSVDPFAAPAAQPAEAQPRTEELAKKSAAFAGKPVMGRPFKAGEEVAEVPDQLASRELALGDGELDLKEVEPRTAESDSRRAGSEFWFRDYDSNGKGQVAQQGQKLREVRLGRSRFVLPDEVETLASDDPYSTFSLNVSDASFQIAKAALARGERPDPASIKPEQFYNAVDYQDPAPAADEPVAVNIDQSAHPVVPGRNLVRIALKTAAAGRAASQPLRLTLLVDHSGSMVREDRRAAMEQALEGLSTLLTANDRVTVIGFSRTPRLLADSLPGDQAKNLADLVHLDASEGGTNLEEALALGERLAVRARLAGAQNRIVLFTDGAANLGNADPEKLATRIKGMRDKGLALDIAGMAADDLNDKLLGELARNGNGRYHVVGKGIDGAHFAKQLAGAFRPAAENVKVQVRFNPERVGHYKLIGFEKDRLKTEDFRNDAVDAAEMAAEEAGVAVYQIEPLPDGSGEIGEVSVRFRDTAAGSMVERSWTISHDPNAPAFDRAVPSMQLAGLATLAAGKLRGGPAADAIDFRKLADVRARVKQAFGGSPRVAELLEMINSL